MRTSIGRVMVADADDTTVTRRARSPAALLPEEDQVEGQAVAGPRLGGAEPGLDQPAGGPPLLPPERRGALDQEDVARSGASRRQPVEVAQDLVQGIPVAAEIG